MYRFGAFDPNGIPINIYEHAAGNELHASQESTFVLRGRRPRIPRSRRQQFAHLYVGFGELVRAASGR
jgi:hypothetical protein